jgi:hypothetical protein
MTTSSTFSVNPLGYEGIDLNSVASVLPLANRVPTTNDVQPSGTIWAFSSTPVTLYMSQGAGNWEIIVPATGTLNTLTGNSGTVTPTTGNINIVGAGGTLVSGAGSTLTITAAPQSFTWNNNAVSAALVVNNGYIVTAGAQSFSLPAVSVVGDEIALVLKGGASWTITQAAGQSVQIGNLTSTVGAGGSVATTSSGDFLVLVCSTANLAWVAQSSVGNLTIV